MNPVSFFAPCAFARRICATLAIVSLLSGCAARELIERQGTTLAKANLGPDQKYAVAVLVKQQQPHSMHSGLVVPLAGEVAQMLREELGVNAVPVDHSEGSAWAAAQSEVAAAPRNEERKFFKLGRTAPYSDHFRSAGYQGYALVTFDETTDGFSRNELDYSVRGALALRAFGVADDGAPTEKLLSRVSTGSTICSRRLHNPPKPGQMEIATDGYYLTNPDRCLKSLAQTYRAQITALLQ